MSTFTYDFDSEDHDAWFDVAIEYGYDPSEIQRGCYDHWQYCCPGQIEVFEVRVKRFERYDDDGMIVEAWNRSAIPTAREKELDALAYDKIVEEVDEWGHLAEQLVRAA